MALTDEQAEKIKEHLLKQLENFPEEKREQIETQVREMDTGQVENFINQNQLTHLGSQCIFCSIISGEIPSVRIKEEKDNIAILEINPLSKAHTLIVPHEHTEKISESTREFAKEISEEIQNKFHPNNIKTNETQIMGHAVIELIPVYGDETERKPATIEELEKVKQEFEEPEKEIEIKPEDKEPELELPKLKVRIP